MARKNLLKGFKKPKGITFEHLETNPNYGKFIAYPFGQYNEDLINSWESSDGLLAFAYGPTRKDYRKASRKDDNYKIPRLNVSHGMEIWKLSLRLLFGN